MTGYGIRPASASDAATILRFIRELADYEKALDAVEATEETIWVRVPVINYLRACPLPEAETAIAELAKIDADAVRRASAFFPFGGSNKAAPAPPPAAENASPPAPAGTPPASTTSTP